MKTTQEIVAMGDLLKVLAKDKYNMILTDGALGDIIRNRLMNKLLEEVLGRIESMSTDELSILLQAIEERPHADPESEVLYQADAVTVPAATHPFPEFQEPTKKRGKRRAASSLS